MNKPGLIWAAVLLAAINPALARADSLLQEIDRIYPQLESLYVDLHQNPELSLHEEQTAAKLASQLQSAGFAVTAEVGGHGVVGVLENGSGPVVLVRTDMDALPVKEQTGLPYASQVVVKNEKGAAIPVMHACGHDIHMASWVGAATVLARAKDKWRGTLVFVGQPAEELLRGAAMMVEDGLLTRFPKPEYVLAVHDTNLLPAGRVGIVSGPIASAANAVNIEFFGKGGHGAQPHKTVDPLLIAARTVVTLQSIVSREINPLDPAVVTVGTFHAGTKRNIISDSATLELTVRSYKPDVQRHLLDAITRIAKAEAAAAGAPREPKVTIDPVEASEVVVNDPRLTERLSDALRKTLGESHVVPTEPSMGSEDFGLFGRMAGAPSVMLRIGAIEPDAFAQAQAAGTTLPGLHSGLFAPDPKTVRAGAAALAISVMELLTHPAYPPSPR